MRPSDVPCPKCGAPAGEYCAPLTRDCIHCGHKHAFTREEDDRETCPKCGAPLYPIATGRNYCEERPCDPPPPPPADPSRHAFRPRFTPWPNGSALCDRCGATVDAPIHDLRPRDRCGQVKCSAPTCATRIDPEESDGTRRDLCRECERIHHADAAHALIMTPLSGTELAALVQWARVSTPRHALYEPLRRSVVRALVELVNLREARAGEQYAAEVEQAKAARAVANTREADRRRSRAADAPGTPWDEPRVPEATPAGFVGYQIVEYPERCQCPYCKQSVRVVPAIAVYGHRTSAEHVLETHPIKETQQGETWQPLASRLSSGAPGWNVDRECTIEYECPASGATVSPWRKL